MKVSLSDPIDGHDPELDKLPGGWILRCSCASLGPFGNGVPVPGSNRAERRTAASHLYRRHVLSEAPAAGPSR